VFHKWESLDGYDDASVDRCFQCGVICAYPLDTPNDPNRSWLIRIGDLRSLIPDCEPGVRAPRNAHRWAVTGKDPFPAAVRPDPKDPDSYCDRGCCVLCGIKIDLDTVTREIPTECPSPAVDIT